MVTSKERDEARGKEQPKVQINLNWIGRRLFGSFLDPPRRHVESFVRNAQTVADLGCGSGYYTFALAECVGPAGKVYEVDLDREAVQSVEEGARKRGFRNIETHASSASDLSFIRDESVDFVLANGLLCSMADGRESAAKEIRRILKPEGLAYLSLGMLPPFGHVDRADWERILQGFKVERRGHGLRVKWAMVSKRRQ